MFMDLYTREGYVKDDIFDWVIVHATKSNKLTPSAAARLANVSGAKHGPPAANPKAIVKVKMTPEDGIAGLVQRVELVTKPHAERQATQAKNEAIGQSEPVKSGIVAKEKVVLKTKVVPEKIEPTTNEPESKTRPKVLNKIATATKPTPALAKPKVKPSIVKPAPVKSPPRLVARVKPKAKLAPKLNLRKVENLPICRSPTPSPPSRRLDMDEVLEKMEDLKISDNRPSTQRGTIVPDPRHMGSNNRKVHTQKSTPSPPLPAPLTTVEQPEQKKAAPKVQPTKPLPGVTDPLSPEVIEISSDSDVVKPTNPGAVQTGRIPLRIRNINSKPVAALVSSPPRRRKNPPRLANVNTNAKSPPRRRVMVTRAAAARKER